jgi:carboxylesterase type B
MQTVTIDTSKGKVTGLRAGNSLKFLGIRYGEPAVNENRFSPPIAVAAAGPKAAVDAATFPNRSMQAREEGSMGRRKSRAR